MIGMLILRNITRILGNQSNGSDSLSFEIIASNYNWSKLSFLTAFRGFQACH